MISKELLSEVLNTKATGEYTISSDVMEYEIDAPNTITKRDYFEINVYRLAHKCKEWAMKEHCLWCVSYVTNIGATCKTYNGLEENDQMFIENTEPEAIFKACQWILDNKD